MKSIKPATVTKKTKLEIFVTDILEKFLILDVIPAIVSYLDQEIEGNLISQQNISTEDPRGICEDQFHQIYIAYATTNTIKVYNNIKEFKLLYQIKPSIVWPMDIFIFNNELYITSYSNEMVLVISLDDKKASLPDCTPRLKLDVPNPAGIVVSPSGEIFISTTRIHVFSQEGQLLRILSQQVLSVPRGITIDHEKNHLYIVDHAYGIYILDALDGKKIHSFRVSGAFDVTLSHSCEHLYITQMSPGTVSVWTLVGECLKTFDGPGEILYYSYLTTNNQLFATGMSRLFVYE